MRNAVLMCLLLVAGGLAGCTGKGGDGAEAAAAKSAAVHDAVEKALGEPLTEDGFDPARPAEMYLNRTASVTGEDGRTPAPAEGYVETAVKGGYAYLCRTGPDEGLVIFDVHDVEHPKQVGYLNLEAGFEADVEVSDDGHWAFWETQRFPTSGETPGTDPTAADPGSVLM